MKLTILGSGTCIPTIKRNAPGYVIKIGKEVILFDAGSGTAKQLVKAKIDYRKINYMFFTHVHPDHVSDLFPILQAIVVRCDIWKEYKRKKPLEIYGPKGFKKKFKSAGYGLWNLKKNPFPIKIFELENSKRKFRGWKIKSQKVQHSSHQSCLGFRIESQGKTIVYAGDTEYCDNLIELSKNADLAIFESSYPDQRPGKEHMTSSEAGKAAIEAGVKKLVLTHFYPICEKYDLKKQAQKTYQGPVILAKDLMEIKI